MYLRKTLPSPLRIRVPSCSSGRSQQKKLARWVLYVSHGDCIKLYTQLRKDIRVVRLNENHQVVATSSLWLLCVGHRTGRVEWRDGFGNPIYHMFPPFRVDDCGDSFAVQPAPAPVMIPWLLLPPQVTNVHINWDHNIRLRIVEPGTYFQYRSKNGFVRRSQFLRLNTQVQGSVRMTTE